MKPLLWSLPIALVVATLPTPPTTALPIDPDAPCFLTTPSGRVIALSSICGDSTKPVAVERLVISQAETGLTVSGIKIRRIAGFNKIKGWIANNSNRNRAVVFLDYQLLDSQTQRAIAISSVFIDKIVPAGGRVGFEAEIDKRDTAGTPVSRLVFDPVNFDRQY